MARTTDKFIASSGYGSISRGVCTGVSDVRLLAFLIQVDNKSGLFCRFLFQHFVFSPCGIKCVAFTSHPTVLFNLLISFHFNAKCRTCIFGLPSVSQCCGSKSTAPYTYFGTVVHYCQSIVYHFQSGFFFYSGRKKNCRIFFSSVQSH